MSSLKKLIFGEEQTVLETKQDPREIVRKWTREIQSQMRKIDRDIENIKREEAKSQIQMKKLAKQGASRASLQNYAKALVKSRQARDRLLVSKVQCNSVVMTLQNMSAQLRVAKTMKASTELMSQVNKMMNIKALQQITMEMSQEMYKANLIEEQINDTFELLEDEEDESLADEEVDKIMDEVIGDQLEGAGTMKYRSKAEQQKAKQEQVENDEEDKMMAQFASLGL
eukprot:UN04677